MSVFFIIMIPVLTRLVKVKEQLGKFLYEMKVKPSLTI